MSIADVQSRVVRGFSRTFSPAQARLADDAAIEGRTALYAIDKDTIEGDIQAATQRSAWAAQIKLLEQLSYRDRAKELLLAQLRRNVREIDDANSRRHPTPENIGFQRMAALGPVGGGVGILGLLGGVRPWMLWSGALASVFAWSGIQTARLNHAKADLNEARDAVETLEQQRDDWKERATQYAQAVTDAREIATQNAQQLEAERRRQARAAETERRRQRELQGVLTNSGEPPAWSLRDDEPPVSQ